MKIKIFCFFALSMLACAACQVSTEVKSQTNDLLDGQVNKQTDNQTTSAKMPVLVELFTSEGCSSCPPADKVLAYLQKEQPFQNAEIIALSQHVDYWDGASWRDPFSSALFSERQTIYARKLSLQSVYTPQMIVDGRTEFVGSDSGKAANAIMDAAKNKKGKIEIALDNGSLKINISELPKHENATIYLAIAENNLASNVKGGENSGEHLEHTAVVRELKTLSAIDPKSSEFSSEINAEIKPDWKKENLKFVVFVQENDSRKILGVGQVKL